MNVFWKLHSYNAVGVFSQPCMSVLEVARAVLAELNQRGGVSKLRLVEWASNAERTLGERKVQEIIIKARNGQRAL